MAKIFENEAKFLEENDTEYRYIARMYCLAVQASCNRIMLQAEKIVIFFLVGIEPGSSNSEANTIPCRHYSRLVPPQGSGCAVYLYHMKFSLIKLFFVPENPGHRVWCINKLKELQHGVKGLIHIGRKK